MFLKRFGPFVISRELYQDLFTFALWIGSFEFQITVFELWHTQANKRIGMRFFYTTLNPRRIIQIFWGHIDIRFGKV